MWNILIAMKKSSVFSVRLDDNQLREVAYAAQTLGIDKSDIVRMAIRIGLPFVLGGAAHIKNAADIALTQKKS